MPRLSTNMILDIKAFADSGTACAISRRLERPIVLCRLACWLTMTYEMPQCPIGGNKGSVQEAAAKRGVVLVPASRFKKQAEVYLPEGAHCLPVEDVVGVVCEHMKGPGPTARRYAELVTFQEEMATFLLGKLPHMTSQTFPDTAFCWKNYFAGTPPTPQHIPGPLVEELKAKDVVLLPSAYFDEGAAPGGHWPPGLGVSKGGWGLWSVGTPAILCTEKLWCDMRTTRRPTCPSHVPEAQREEASRRYLLFMRPRDFEVALVRHIDWLSRAASYTTETGAFASRLLTEYADRLNAFRALRATRDPEVSPSAKVAFIRAVNQVRRGKRHGGTKTGVVARLTTDAQVLVCHKSHWHGELGSQVLPPTSPHVSLELLHYALDHDVYCMDHSVYRAQKKGKEVPGDEHKRQALKGAISELKKAVEAGTLSVQDVQDFLTTTEAEVIEKTASPLLGVIAEHGRHLRPGSWKDIQGQLVPTGTPIPYYEERGIEADGTPDCRYGMRPSEAEVVVVVRQGHVPGSLPRCSVLEPFSGFPICASNEELSFWALPAGLIKN